MDLPRVLVTRARQQASELAERLRALGLEPVVIPAIEIAEPTSFDPLDAALASLATFDWLLFTSANAVEIAMGRLRARDEAMVAVRTGLKIAAIGKATSRALSSCGMSADVLPLTATGESLAEALLGRVLRLNSSPTRFLLIRAEEGRDVLPEALRAAGADVTIAPAYRTVIPERSIAQARELLGSDTPSQTAAIEAITFTSSSTVRNLIALCDAARVQLPEAALRISIGPITSRTLRDFDLPPHAEAEEATAASLAEAVQRTLKRRP